MWEREARSAIYAEAFAYAHTLEGRLEVVTEPYIQERSGLS
jgi:hypothetical protein